MNMIDEPNSMKDLPGNRKFDGNDKLLGLLDPQTVNELHQLLKITYEYKMAKRAQEYVETAADIGKSTVEVAKDALSNITYISRKFLLMNGCSPGESESQYSGQNIIIVQPANKSSGFGVDYFSIFLGATGYWVASSMNLKSYTDILTEYHNMPTHLTWGCGFGLAACAVACIFPPYTKWLVATLIGYKIWRDIVRPTLNLGDDELELS